jgi:hypothetical protein
MRGALPPHSLYTFTVCVGAVYLYMYRPCVSTFCSDICNEFCVKGVGFETGFVTSSKY